MAEARTVMQRGRIVRLLAVLLCLLPATAGAQTFDAALPLLASTDGEVLRQGIEELASCGDLRGLPVLEALQQQRLRVDESGRVLVQEERRLVDVRRSAPAAPAAALRSPVVSNATRRVLGHALAHLRLASPDAAVRLGAAQELSSRGASVEAAPELRRLAAGEPDARVRHHLRLALARLDLSSGEPASRYAAVGVIRAAGDVTMKPDLERLLGKNADGSFVEPDEQVREAAHDAVVALNGRILLFNGIAALFHGLSLGSVLLLAALGLAITFGLMRVINMAHGEMLMLGAYSTFLVQEIVQRHAPALFDWYLLGAVPFAFAVCTGVGMALERSVIRFLYGRPLETLLATWGISLLLIQTVRLTFGAQNVAVANPSWLSGGLELLPTVVLPYSRLAVIVFVMAVASFVWLLLRRTRLGLHVRAVTQNREIAASLGICTSRVDMWTFGLGSGAAGLGGVALSQLGNVGPELGQQYIVDSFMVVVLGGVGNLAGCIAGAMGLGVLNKLIEPAAGAVLGKIAILGLIILFIQKRPQGLFALKGRAAEV